MSVRKKKTHLMSRIIFLQIYFNVARFVKDHLTSVVNVYGFVNIFFGNLHGPYQNTNEVIIFYVICFIIFEYEIRVYIYNL